MVQQEQVAALQLIIVTLSLEQPLRHLMVLLLQILCDLMEFQNFFVQELILRLISLNQVLKLDDVT